jgi:hypothetical protein
MPVNKPAKPSVKNLMIVIAKQADTIKELTEALDAERKSIRLPETMTVPQYNAMVDFLNSTKPEPLYPKEVPAKLIVMGEGGEA